MHKILRKFFSLPSRSASINLQNLRYVRRAVKQTPTQEASKDSSSPPSIQMVEEKLDLKSIPNIPTSARVVLENNPEFSESLKKRRVKFSFDSKEALDKYKKSQHKSDEILTLDTLVLAEDAKVPKSRIDCPGCGARLHCQNKHVEGFMPADIFKSLSKKELAYKLCYRCEILNTKRKILNVETNNSFDYDKFIVERIRGEVKAHVILLVDLLDIPNSIYDGWSKLIDQTSSQNSTDNNEVKLFQILINCPKSVKA